jgi:hypothetical protein
VATGTQGFTRNLVVAGPRGGGLRYLLVAGFSIAAKQMASRYNNAICGDIDRGGISLNLCG